MSLSVEVAGPAGARAMVFLHGVGTSGWMWWQQVPAFADHFCLTVDLPGHGHSHAVAWVSLADTAAQVAALIRARTVGGRAHVVGVSLGGQVALTLLERHPEVLDRVVVSGVTAEPWPHPWLLGPQTWLTTRQLRSRRLLEAQARSLRLPPPARAALVENALAMSAQTYGRIIEEVAGYRVPGSLGAAPTLVLAGSTESDLIRRAVETVPGATGRIVPGAGHGWNVQAPDLFNATVRAWIQDGPHPG